jgi:predicted pyridoxine 5'-phosphate oxidase superfamily flavin-nucleotide-binding protein
VTASTTIQQHRFHPGELEVQHRAGVSREAARLEGMLAAPRLDGGAANFLARREFAVLTARDGAGRLWTSPLLGPAGFLEAHGTSLDVHAAPSAADPLAGMPAGGPAGLIAIEFAIRRRFRVNGTLAGVSSHGLIIEADQAFGNCPSYIQQRVFDAVGDDAATVGTSSADGWEGGKPADLTPDARSLIRTADTFFLGTAHPQRGADTSHKGGRPGFVRIEGEELWWPDYAGNNMFNSLGNIAANPEATLLFVDFATGRTLQLTGAAELQWIKPGSAGDDGDTGRRIRFRPDAITAGSVRLPIRSARANQSPDNPDLKP